MVLNNILGNVSGAVSEVTGNPSGGGNKFRKTLKTTDFMSGDASLTTGQFKKIGTFTVPAQEQYRWGQGAAKYEANQGYVYILTQTSTPSEVAGTIRLEQRDAQERNIITVFEEEEEVLHGSKSDRTQKQALPEQTSFPRVGRDSKLTISMDPDADATVDDANTDILAPVTVYPV